MKIITSPSVHVLAAPQFFDHPDYVLPHGGTDAERLIAHAGKGCYDSYGADGRNIKDHIEGHITSRHGSVLEHATVSLFISGISRGCSHEIVRHRAGFAYSQRSTRYTEEAGAAFVLEPYLAGLYSLKQTIETLTMDESAIINRALRSYEDSLAAYKDLSNWLMGHAPAEFEGTARRKWARGKARQSLPHALETRLTMTGNLRAWRFFLEERSARGAEPEIRRLANAVMLKVAPIAPIVFDDMLADSELIDGFLEFHPRVPKV